MEFMRLKNKEYVPVLRVTLELLLRPGSLYLSVSVRVLDFQNSCAFSLESHFSIHVREPQA